jgi:hypothetical protein
MVSTPLKNMKVQWDDCSQYMESHKTCSSHHQPVVFMVTPFNQPYHHGYPLNSPHWVRSTHQSSGASVGTMSPSPEPDVHPIAGVYRWIFSRFCCRYPQVFSPLCFFFQCCLRLKFTAMVFQNGDFWNQLTNSGIVSAQTTVRYGRFQAQEDHLFS